MRTTTHLTRLLLAGVVGLAATCAAAPASADTTEISPPGANDWSCVPSAAHPDPVVLVPGTFESMLKNWAVLSPYLKQRGFCVFALDYGVTNGVPATGPIADSAGELADFVDAVLGATGARKVDLVGHSQGGMMPRYYIEFLGGAQKVDDLVGIAPSNHGTTLVPSPLVELSGSPESADSDEPAPAPPVQPCAACTDQTAGSAFLTTLNAGGDTRPGPSYTVLATRYDEIVMPYTSQFLVGPDRQVTNVTLQDRCPLDPIEHDQAPNDPVVHQWVLNALSTAGPADPSFRPVCL